MQVVTSTAGPRQKTCISCLSVQVRSCSGYVIAHKEKTTAHNCPQRETTVSNSGLIAGYMEEAAFEVLTYTFY